ncbi:MAG: hypothetical protein WAO23_02970 [Dethiobacteria bacterium]
MGLPTGRRQSDTSQDVNLGGDPVEPETEPPAMAHETISRQANIKN